MRDKRLDDMEEYILAQKDSSLDELCEKYQISKNTVRRDIEELLLRGNIKKDMVSRLSLPGSIRSCSFG